MYTYMYIEYKRPLSLHKYIHYNIAGGSPHNSVDPNHFDLPMLTPKQLERILNTCNVHIHGLLDMENVFPYLVEENLLTQDEQEMLCSISSTLSSDNKKITHLVKILPKKGSTALPRFLKCLRRAARGTAHEELADLLRKEALKVTEIHPQTGISLVVSYKGCTGALVSRVSLWAKGHYRQ